MGTTYYLQCKRRPKFFQSYLKPHSWTYLKEKLVRSFISCSQGGSFMIRTAIKKPSHLLVRSINGAKTLQTKIRIHLFLTLLRLDQQLLQAQTDKKLQMQILKLSRRWCFFSETENKTRQKWPKHTEHCCAGYGKQFSDYLNGPTINVNSFDKLHGTLYFDLTNQEIELKNGSTKLELHYSLTAATANDYILQVLVSPEEELSVDNVFRKVVLRV